MKKMIFIIYCALLFTSCDQAYKVNNNQDKYVLKSIKTKKKVCETPYNCIKPVNLQGTKVKALEIKIHSTEKASFITYDKNGKPIDLEDDYVIQIRATKVPATLDADVIKK